ncbi:MAG TPA: nuclear transport factor 2 family protein [Chitinophagaceae bacterium]|nr:nuclear transport factor 2 family protein [Chitinophagaceae bacterium]
MIINKIIVVFLFAFLAFIISCTSDTVSTEIPSVKYTPVSRELFDTILHMDRILFDAVNTKDFEKLKTLFSDSLEFYHDKDGLQGYSKTMENFKLIFENKNLADLRREAVPGSMEVYPIHNYGAVQTGSHTFCHTENGKPDCGTFKFVHVWQKKDGQWKLSRVISFDHK